VELRTFAEIILYGNNLATDKLFHPCNLTDEKPGSAIEIPKYPNRPYELDFARQQNSKKVEFPNQNNIENEYQRGIVLHFFANHELLAMELMALTLLRFPDAPKNFRMGIAKTILEEQRHMQMYIQRMNDFNVAFGEISVNDFFWKCLSNMQSPIDYVTKLSMTFEQANLDFSFFYMNLMQKIGDKKTAEILKIVFEEEIGHVKHGVVWFDKWRDTSLSQWECYVNQLKLPLTPARAKGLIFDKEARIKAGLSEDFINELSVFSASKGRPPDIFYFNPSCELEIERNKVGFNATKPVKLLQEDCACLCLFLAAQDDIVLVPKKPSLYFLQNLKKCGFDLPEWHEYSLSEIDIKKFEQNIFGSLKPWGWSPESEYFLKPLLPQVKFKENIIRKMKDYRNIFSKLFSAQLSIEINEKFSEFKDIISLKETLPVICYEIDSVKENIKTFLNEFEMVVLKKPYGSAGQNMLRVNSFNLCEKDLNWIKKVLQTESGIVVEPWYKRVADFSSQLKIENNRLIYLGETRLLTDNRGQYFGTMLGKKMDYLAQDVVKFLYTSHSEMGLNFLELLKQVSLFVGEKLLSLNFDGPFGLDVFIYKDSKAKYGYRIKFISEINPRYTMGRVALEISKRVLPGVASLWVHLRKIDIERDFLSVENFFNKVTNSFPLEVSNSYKPQIKKGVLFTNDALFAKNTITVLISGNEYINEFVKLIKRNI
jgi:uncharacterized ferritin-like protein (DUF455 family)